MILIIEIISLVVNSIC